MECIAVVLVCIQLQPCDVIHPLYIGVNFKLEHLQLRIHNGSLVKPGFGVLRFCSIDPTV